MPSELLSHIQCHVSHFATILSPDGVNLVKQCDFGVHGMVDRFSRAFVVKCLYDPRYRSV